MTRLQLSIYNNLLVIPITALTVFSTLFLSRVQFRHIKINSLIAYDWHQRATPNYNVFLTMDIDKF